MKGQKTYFTVAIAALYLLGAYLKFWPADEKIIAALSFAAIAFLRAGVAKGPITSFALLCALCVMPVISRAEEAPPLKVESSKLQVPAAPNLQPATCHLQLDDRFDGKLDEAPAQNFRANEFSLDLYTAATAKDLTGHVEFGGGVGANYFFTRGFGAGARVTAWNTTERFIDEISARLIARAPLWDRVAPYGYVEGVYDATGGRADSAFKDGHWGAGAGGGIEVALFGPVHLKAEAGLRVDTDGRGSFQGTGGITIPFTR